jgi:hypothetical protein
MKNRRIPLACCLPIVVVTLTGCQQSSSGPVPEDASLLAPSVDTAAKGDATKPIRILSGQLIFDRATDTHSIDLKGTQGLRLAMTVVDFLAFFAPTLDCLPCVPGDVVRVDAFLVGSSLAGGWQLRGKTFSVGDPMDPTGPGAGLQFTGGTVVLPPIPEDQTAVLSAPFEFTGTLFSGDFTTPAETLIGQGVATLHFGVEPLSPGEFGWRTTRVVYEFTH